jgi:ribonuclease H / adenosylcobalamin/alpha-ribazole phosphatase
MLPGCAALLLLAVPDPLAALGPVPAGTVRVYLVRHGQALSNLVPPPPPSAAPRGLDHLTALGESQAQKAGAVLAGRGVTLVLTSPAGRARETSDKIASALGLAPARVETRLRPMDLGTDASGKALSWDDREKEWAAGRDPVPPGGESMAQMGERVVAVVKQLRTEAPAGNVVAVAHGEVIAALVGALKATPPARVYPPRIANASITVVEARADGSVALLLSNHVPRGMPSQAP